MLVLFILLLPCLLMAQHGSPLLTHYTESRDIENQNWAICQDENNVMLFANRKGILVFDGAEWSLLRIPAVPYSMQKNPYNGKIYIGGYNNFGFLEKDAEGSYSYVSLSGNIVGVGVITKIAFRDSLVYFYGDRSLIRYNLRENVFEMNLNSRPDLPYTGLIITSQNTFVNVTDKGLYRIDSDTLFPIVTGYLTEKEIILFSLPYDEYRVLVGFGSGRLALFDGIKYYDYTIKDENYLQENILSEGIMLGDSTFAFSTLEGGALIVDKYSRDVRFTLNNQNSLPDDEIFAIGSDNTGGLWLSHQYGLTRADLSLPVENYTILPGLHGNLSSALTFNDELYVATSEGVYYLAEVKNYTEVEVLIKKEEPIKTVSVVNEAEMPEQKAEKGRKGIFARILGRTANHIDDIDSDDREEIHVVIQDKPVEQYTWKTVSKLKSIDNIYRKVEGMNEKCRQLVSTPYGILAATNQGLYAIKDHKAELIMKNRYINYIAWTPVGSRYWVGASGGYFAVSFLNGHWRQETPDPGFTNPVYSILQEDSRTLWLGIDNAAYKANLKANNNKVNYIPYVLPNDFPERYMIDMINDTIYIFTEAGIHYYDPGSDRFEFFHEEGASEEPGIIVPVSNHRFYKRGKEWKSLDKPKTKENELSLLKIFDDIVALTLEPDKIWLIDENNQLFGIDRARSSNVKPEVNVYIKSISNGKGVKFTPDNVNFERGDNVLNFEIIAPGYLKQNSTQYQYFIEGNMEDWSPWSERTVYERTIANPGNYTLQIRARDLWGNISEIQSVRFNVKAPFTRTAGFYVATGLLLLLLIIFVIRFRERQLRNKTKFLEDKVQERTFKIESQKQEITSSIEYASRIQMAMLPTEDHIKELFDDYFVIFKPRDIVSGDFYWIGEDSKSVFFTVADCTGHGVPGAFMSTMGISTLNEIISNNHNLQANKILNLLRTKTMTALHQTGKIGEAADGMDIAFCALDKKKNILQYSGAFNPLIIFQGGELKEYKADRMPIGIYYGEEISFTNYLINVSRGDTLYIFSDGYASQFGGPGGTKYKKSNLRKLLSEIYYRPMDEQRKILLEEFERWKGAAGQVDDVTILGIRL